MDSAEIIALDHEILNLNQIYKIVEECMDFSFLICNTELEHFTMSKIFDVFNQTLPTAILLNTGYWPFYNNMRGQSLCICGRYGIDCRHHKNSSHWIDLQSPVEDNLPSTVFYPKYYGALHPTDYFIQVEPDDDLCDYSIMINMRLQYKQTERGRKKQDKNRRVPDSNIYTFKETFSILAKFSICHEHYPAFQTYVFQPSPIFHEFYGHHFFRLSFDPDTLPPVQNLTIPLDEMSKITLRLVYVNLNFYEYVNCTLTVFPLQFQHFKIKCTKFKNKKNEEMKRKRQAYMRNLIINMNHQEKPHHNELNDVSSRIKMQSKMVKQEMTSSLEMNSYIKCEYNDGSLIESPGSSNVNNIVNNNIQAPALTKEQIDVEFDVIYQWMREDISKHK